MTIAEMREIVGLPDDATDAEVVAAYAALLAGDDAAPPEEPITLAEARAQLREPPEADDAMIRGYIVAAREWVENFTGLILARREVVESLTGFASVTRLRAWPIAAGEPITLAYRDRAGVDEIIEDGVVHASTRPAILYPAVGKRWPALSATGSRVSAILTAGYADADSVPQVLKTAMLVLITGFYEDREGGDMFQRAEASARGLCRAHRWRSL